MKKTYDDIIHLPRHISAKHPQMARIDRAAQFSPFAALTGYDSAIKETSRLTAERTELDEYEKDLLNDKLQIVAEHLQEHPEVTITYFQSDEKKDGGAYVTVIGAVKKIDRYEKRLVMASGIRIPIDDIFGIEGEIVNTLTFSVTPEQNMQ